MPSKTNRNKTAQAIRYDVSNADSTCWNKRAQPFNPLGTNYGNMPSCEQESEKNGIIQKKRRTNYCSLPSGYAARLRDERIKRGKSMRQVSLAFGINRSTYESLEYSHGMISEKNYDKAKNIAKKWQFLDVFGDLQ